MSLTMKISGDNIPLENGKDISDIDTSEEIQNFNNNSIEVIRKSSQTDIMNNSWEPSCYVSFEEICKGNEYNKAPVFVSTMATDGPCFNHRNSMDSSTQTDPFVTLPNNDCSIVDVSLSFSKDFNIHDSTSNDNSEQSVGSKRFRPDCSDGDNRELRPWKKTKCSDSNTSSTSDLTERKVSLEPSLSSRELSSNSDVSFKSINSNRSFRVRKRRLKSDSNLFRDALQRSRKNINLSKYNYSENSTPGGTPRKEKNQRRYSKLKPWKIVDLCAWIGRKGYQSITGLYSDILREPLAHKEYNDASGEELKQLRKFLEEVDIRQSRLAKENEVMKEGMMKMMTKIDELEGKLRRQECQRSPRQGPPPPPPPPPPPASKLPMRSHTIPRCGSAPPRIAGPRLTITPQDIANVKLRKAKDNPVRSKPKDDQPMPLVTQQMLQSTRAKLGRARPVAASTPKQQLSELEKCLLQETTMTSLYRRRASRGSFRSAEELRARPYPASRGPRSPHSPRSNSLPRVTLKSPLKLPNGSILKQ